MKTQTDTERNRERLAKEIFPEEFRSIGLDPVKSESLSLLYADLRMRRAKKGILLFGTPGTGKTTAMKFFSNRFQIPWFSAIWIANDSSCYELGDWYRWFCLNFGKSDIIIDDLGSERDIKKYGNEGIISDIISFREQAYQEFGALTHFTTNLMGEKGTEKMLGIEQRYGARIASRIIGMCDIVMLTGNDRRRGK